MSINRFKLSTVLVLAVFATAALLLVGCDSKSRSEDAPSGTTMVVTASPSTVTEGATTVIEATITSGGVGVAEQIVTFSNSGTGDGYFTPAVDTTGADGIAATVFTATTSGSVTISGTVNGTTIGSSIAVSVQDSQTQTGSGNIDLTVSPSLLLANGIDTAHVTVVVRDELGQPAADSTVVKITAGEKFVDIDGNGYWSPGIDSLVFDANANGTWDAYGLIPSVALTSGGTGQISVNYVSGSDAMTVYIKVTVDEDGITGQAEVPLQLTPNASISSIFMSSDSIQLAVKQTGGVETSLLRASGYDMNGNAVPEGLQINFVIIDGPGGGEHLANVGYGPFTAITNSQGTATCPISSGTISGTVRVRCYADTVLSNATQLLISAGPPQYIVVGAEKCNVDYWDNVAEENAITAVVSDIYLNPVNDSTVVYFSTDEGTMQSHLERTQDWEGIAYSMWFSGNNVATADGRVWVYAETAGGTVLDSSMFFNSHYPDTIFVSGVPASMYADDESEAVVYVAAVDLNDNPVIGGTTFEAEANFLKVSGGTFENGCYGASDRIKITSATLKVDRSVTGGNDDGIGAIDLVQFWHGAGAFTAYNVTMLTGDAYAGNSKINGQATASMGEVVPLSVTIKDRWGNPLADHTLNTSASLGVISGATRETNGYGEAGNITWTAPPAAGSYTITVVDADPRGGITITLQITVEE